MFHQDRGQPHGLQVAVEADLNSLHTVSAPAAITAVVSARAAAGPEAMAW
ncbi:hypothetical protein [Lentzea pudingi]|nr:hypothetical protein [Lentzea pudingi]